MHGRCSRTQCGAPAVARVAFDSLGCMVWIDRYDSGGPLDVSARGAGALCARHADRLVPPRGWAVQDRRGPELQLWSDRPAPPTPTLDAPSVTRPARAPATGIAPPRIAVLEQNLPFDTGTGSGTDGAVAVDDGRTLVGQPAVDEHEIDRLLATPRSPLLSRAFNAAHTRQAG